MFLFFASYVMPVASAAAIYVYAPNGGENWEAGTYQWIEWGYEFIGPDVKIELYKGDSYQSTIVASTPKSPTYYEWTIPVTQQPGNDYKVRITCLSTSTTDYSDDYFTILPPPVITVTSPTSKSVWTTGATYDITWTSSGSVGDLVKIEYDYDFYSSSTAVTIESLWSNTGSYSWTIPYDITPRTDYLIRITSDHYVSIFGDSQLFTIEGPSVVVTSPTSSSVWTAGETYDITWTSSGSVGSYVKMEYDYDYYSSSTAVTIVSSTSNDGTYSWTIPTTITPRTSYLIRITSTSYSSVYDDSSLFEIRAPTGTVAVTSPTSSSVWTAGETYDITWTSSGTVGSEVKIEYDYAYYSAPVTITSSTSNDGSYSWMIPSDTTPRTNYLIRITSTSYPSIFDDSNLFTIAAPSGLITVTSPTSSSVWSAGNTYSITWTSTGIVGSYVSIEYDFAYYYSPVTIISSTSNDGSHSWTISSDITPRTNYLIRVTSTSYPSVYDDSDLFTIAAPSGLMTVTSPTSSSVWTAGNTYSITWTSSGTVGSEVKIEYDYAYYSAPVTITSSTSNDGSYSWMIPSDTTPRTNYLIRITSTSYPSIFDDSDLFEVEGAAVASEYHELRVTLRSDGTEHNYIRTTDPSVWKTGTFWESGDAYNKQESTEGIYTILEYDLDDIELYSQGAQTSLTSEGSGSSRIWIYQDYFEPNVDVYVLTLPSGSVHESSTPTPDSVSNLVLTWHNITGETTRFKCEQYNELAGGTSSVSLPQWILISLLIAAVLAAVAILFLILARKNQRKIEPLRNPSTDIRTEVIGVTAEQELYPRVTQSVVEPRQDSPLEAAVAGDIEAKLAQLKSMREKGLISDQDYDEKKRNLLGRL